MAGHKTLFARATVTAVNPQHTRQIASIEMVARAAISPLA